MTAESNDNVNDAEKDESGKDNDAASVLTDNEGSKASKQGTHFCDWVTVRLSNFSMQGEKPRGERKRLRVERSRG